MLEFLLSLYGTGIDYVNIFLASTFFLVVKIIIAIYSAVLILNIVLLTYLGDVKKRYRQLRHGTGNIPTQGKKADQRWDEIMEHLDTMDDAQWKLAILKSDTIIDKELARMGYTGDHLSEKLSQLPEQYSELLPQIQDAHKVRNSIVRDDSLSVTHAQATDIVENMQEFLEDLGAR